jgi:hypothetical protein
VISQRRRQSTPTGFAVPVAVRLAHVRFDMVLDEERVGGLHSDCPGPGLLNGRWSRVLETLGTRAGDPDLKKAMVPRRQHAEESLHRFDPGTLCFVGPLGVDLELGSVAVVTGTDRQPRIDSSKTSAYPYTLPHVETSALSRRSTADDVAGYA